MALKLGPGTTLPPQHSAVAALPPQVVTGAIDCTEISPSLPPAVIATSVPQTKPVAASLESSKKPEKPKGPGYRTTRPLSSVKACEVHYLWKPYLPAGELAILSGDPGVGKTWIAQGISADLTRGRIPFTHAPRPPAAVLYLTVENSPEELRRRFTSQGGNLDLLHIVDDPVRLSDIESLDGALQETKPALMVVDPIQSFLGPVDTYRANKIRPVLDGLALLAKKHGCCILLLRHLTKGATGRGIYRGSGGH
jgi:hypothetical protein